MPTSYINLVPNDFINQRVERRLTWHSWSLQLYSALTQTGTMAEQQQVGRYLMSTSIP